MTVFGYVSGSAKRQRVHVIAEMGEPTDAEEKEHRDGGRRDYEVKYVISRCGIDSRKLGWKGFIVVNVSLEERYVCAVCKRLMTAGKKDSK